jgi:hypothetical protein
MQPWGLQSHALFEAETTVIRAAASRAAATTASLAAGG